MLTVRLSTRLLDLMEAMSLVPGLVSQAIFLLSANMIYSAFFVFQDKELSSHAYFHRTSHIRHTSVIATIMTASSTSTGRDAIPSASGPCTVTKRSHISRVHESGQASVDV